jgi:Fe2+ transport system protein B
MMNDNMVFMIAIIIIFVILYLMFATIYHIDNKNKQKIKSSTEYPIFIENIENSHKSTFLNRSLKIDYKIMILRRIG